MPVDHDVIDSMARNVRDVYAEAELALLRMMTARLAKGLDASGWAQRKYSELFALRRAAAAIVDQLDADAGGVVRRHAAAAYGEGNDRAVHDITQAVDGLELDNALRSVRAVRGGAVQALADALVRELRPLHSQILPQVDSTFRRAIAGAAARALAGVATQRQAAQAAWNTLVDAGITSYTDRGGRRWRLASYVEMATRTAFARAATQALIDGYRAAGESLVYVPDMPGECALCRPWENAILSLGGNTGDTSAPHARYPDRDVEVHVKATLDEARAAGLHHPNCRHVVALYRPGVTHFTKATADPEGEAARVRQRYLERQMRHWRERAAAAFDDQSRYRALRYVQAWSAEMERHLDATGLPRLRYREKPGAGIATPAHRRADRASVPSI